MKEKLWQKGKIVKKKIATESFRSVMREQSENKICVYMEKHIIIFALEDRNTL